VLPLFLAPFVARQHNSTQFTNNNGKSRDDVIVRGINNAEDQRDHGARRALDPKTKRTWNEARALGEGDKLTRDSKRAMDEMLKKREEVPAVEASS